MHLCCKRVLCFFVRGHLVMSFFFVGFARKGVLRNFKKFTGKHLCQSLFFNKVAGPRPFHRTLIGNCFIAGTAKIFYFVWPTRNSRNSWQYWVVLGIRTPPGSPQYVQQKYPPDVFYKKLFLKTLQYSQGHTFVWHTGVLLWILRNFEEHIF